MKQLTVFRDQEKIDHEISKFNEFLPKYKKLIKEFNDLQLGKLETKEDFEAAVQNPEMFMDARVRRFVARAEMPEVGGIRLKQQSVIDMLDLKEISEFVEASRAIDITGQSAFTVLGELVNGVPVLDADLQKKWVDRHSEYATTAAEKEACLIMQPAAAAVQKMIDLGLDPRRIGLPADGWLLQHNSRQARVNIQGFRQLARMIENK